MRMFTAASVLASLAVASAAFAGDITILLGNNSWNELKAVAWSPAGADDWTEVALSDGKLAAGDFVEMVVSEGDTPCIFDLRFTKADDSQHDRPDVDLCAATYYHFADQ